MVRARVITAAALAATLLAACSGGNAAPTHSPDGEATSPPAAAIPAVSSPPASTSRPAPRTSTVRRTPPAPTTSSATPVQHTDRSHSLPVAGSAADARQVITVVADSTSSTSASLQAWDKVSGGWRRSGSSVTAQLGSDGLSRHASETSTATPIGSFTLTQAFGHDSNPGTRLPYFHTTPADWWISQSGPLYNTHQHCSSGCSFTQGSPNEHLYYETPYYDYAVVIDYNTSDAPGGVQAGRGSAFFLHVTVDPTTQGCVSVPADRLVRLLRWLDPADHPRIMIGVR